jgi:hypothetical protein
MVCLGSAIAEGRVSDVIPGPRSTKRDERGNMSKHKHLGLLALAALAYLLPGCVPAVSYRANPRFQEQAQKIHTVLLLPPKVTVYQIDAGSVREEITEWSAQARLHSDYYG